MCWTPPYTRHKTKTSKIQKHSTLCVGHHHTQDTRRRHTKQKHSTLCVGHHLTQDTRPRQAKYKNTAHYVLDTTIHKTQDEDTLSKNTAHYVLDTTVHKTQDEDKQNTKTKHNMCWTPPYTRHKTKFSPSEYIRSFPFLLGVVRVAQFFVYCVAICRPLFVCHFFLFVIELFVILRFIAFDYHLVF
jgi:hypothetical protein